MTLRDREGGGRPCGCIRGRSCLPMVSIAWSLPRRISQTLGSHYWFAWSPLKAVHTALGTRYAQRNRRGNSHGTHAPPASAPSGEGRDRGGPTLLQTGCTPSLRDFYRRAPLCGGDREVMREVFLR